MIGIVVFLTWFKSFYGAFTEVGTVVLLDLSEIGWVGGTTGSALTLLSHMLFMELKLDMDQGYN